MEQTKSGLDGRRRVSKPRLEKLKHRKDRRKKPEEAQQLTLKEWPHILNAISDWVCLIDLKGRILRTNSMIEAFTGVRPDESIGQHCCRLVHGTDERLPGCPVPEMLRTGRRVTVELEVPDKKSWLMVTVDPVRDKTGNITGAVHIACDITDRTQADESLRKNEQFLAAVFESIREGLSILNPDLTIRYVNSVMNKWYQQNLPLEGKKCYQCYHNKTMPCEPCPTLRCIETGKTEREIVPGLKGSQTEWVELFSYPMKDPKTSEITGVVEFVRDITERKQAEEALRESEEKVRTLYDSSSDAIMLLDEKGYFDCNDATLRLFGCASREEFCSRHPADFSPPTQPCGTDSLTLANQRIATAMQTGCNRFEWMHKRIDSDEAFPANVLLDAMELGGKKVLQARVYDITERKQAEEALQCERDFAESLVKTAQTIVLVLDTEGRILRFNPYMEEISGYRRKEVQGKDWFTTFLPKRDRKRMRELFLKAASDIQTHGNVNSIITKDGHERQIEWHDKTLKDTDGNITGLLTIGQDITDRKQAEGELEKLNKQLESTVKELSIANRELKDFAHITAHDLKAPLRGIGTLAEWLATDYADKFDDQGRKQVGLLVQRSQEMYDQITGILQFSEIGQGEHQCERIDLNGLIETIIASVNPPENIQITIADKLPTLVCAQVHLTQVFQNLLSNAIDYADKADGQVTIGCVVEGDFWKFNVTDNGPGIEEKYFDKIFQIFQTLPVEGEHRGTGIGLAIVRKAVEMYGGKIWLKSSLGRGTTFFFTFPKQEMKAVCDEKLEANIVG